MAAVVRGVLCALILLAVILPVYAWYGFETSPRDVLTEPSSEGALRIFGDYPRVDPDVAARETVDALVKAGGLDMKVLFVALPTGSGWVDPAQVEAIEDWAGNDVASVSVRYARVPSAVAFTLRPGLATESAQALFRELSSRLAARDPEHLPAVVVYGQSLGAKAGVAALATSTLPVSAQLWQGRPGALRHRETGPCVVDISNRDDPVAQLSWDLVRHPVRAIRVLNALPGSSSAAPGTAHSYRPVLPPSQCLGGVKA